MKPRHIFFALALMSLFFSIACSSTNKSMELPTRQQPKVQPTPIPSPPEEVVTETPSQAVVSEESVQEEIPTDLVALNAKGYLKDVFFDTDSYDLSPEARDMLAANATWLRSYPSINIRIEGHCDERNTREYNLALGERRASAVRDYLVFLGVSPDRIRTISYGEEKPFAQGHTESAWKLNRRAHFLITAR